MNCRITAANHEVGLKGEALFREHGKQVAALCWRARPVLEVQLITSLNSKRWILPKGWPEADLTAAESAAREAFEEAGVVGKVSAKPIGTYHYLKEKKDGSGLPCSVEVFALSVTKQLHEWPEKGARTLAWVPLDQAIKQIGELGLRPVLKEFRKAHNARRAAPVKRRA